MKDQIDANDADTETIAFEKLPPAVQRAAHAQFGASESELRTSKMVDEGTVAYEITGIRAGATAQLLVNDTGETISLTEEVPFNRLPEHVRETLRDHHPKGKFSAVKKVTTYTYTASWHDTNGEHELDVDGSGLTQFDSDTDSEGTEDSYQVLHTSLTR